MYYIGTGSKSMMFTLRQRWEEESDQGFEITIDIYICNLATDPERAEAKARAIAPPGELQLESIPDLVEIRRREIEEIRLIRQAREQREQDEFNSRVLAKIDTIEAGFFPFGIYRDERFEKADNGYILYMLKCPNEDDDAVFKTLKSALTHKFPHLANLPKPNGKYYPNDSGRESFTAVMIEDFGFEGYYGYIHIQKLVCESGELITYMGSAPPFRDIGESYTFNATIKCHEEYKGEKQTKIQRVAFPKCKAAA